MFAAIGRFAVRRRWWVVAAALVVTVVGGLFGSTAMGLFTGGAGFVDPRSESNRADELLESTFAHDGVDVIVVYESRTRTVDDPAFASAIATVVGRLPAAKVGAAHTYWSTKSPQYVSKDRHATYVTLTMAGEDRAASYTAIKDSLAAPGLTATHGGPLVFPMEINRLSMGDVVRAEVISLPILMLLLVLVFRSAVAAGLPLAIGLITMFGSLTLLRLLTSLVDVSTYAFQIVTVLGLGLAIDYALLLVTRFREELETARDVEDAVARTMATAGRAVVFSGLTLATCFLGLLIFPQLIYRSIGYAGAAVVLFAVGATLTVLPALLGIAGHRVNSLRVPLPRRSERGWWYRLAHGAMRRPVVTTVTVGGLLIALGAPFLGVRWGIPDPALLPADASSRIVAEQLGGRFDRAPDRVMTAVVTPVTPRQAQEYAARLGQVDGVDGVTVTGQQGDVARLTMAYRAEPTSDAAARMARELRAVPAPSGATALVTGRPATLLDVREAVADRMPWFALFVAVACGVLLFWAFGSVVLPLKSIVMNMLSLSASFGAITLIFQNGFLSGLLGFDPAGWLDVVFPVIILVMAFGLALDYEVFLVSRIREEWDRTHDSAESVAVGAQRSSGVISSAALLLLVVVGGFTLGQVTLMKMIGVGLVIAIGVDATIVRGLLVPATMRLLGRWAWWAPAPLSRWWSRHGLRETSPAAPGPENPRGAEVFVKF
ncbi:MMPL family transporter [Nonomuraea sp. NPDC049400]|uniref:MMPL family transporter n=1 Tax=Nonomuraea sp. NPDC049400 TaxID=3364352 RepID=UPI0037881529